MIETRDDDDDDVTQCSGFYTALEGVREWGVGGEGEKREEGEESGEGVQVAEVRLVTSYDLFTFMFSFGSSHTLATDKLVTDHQGEGKKVLCVCYTDASILRLFSRGKNK